MTDRDIIQLLDLLHRAGFSCFEVNEKFEQLGAPIKKPPMRVFEWLRSLNPVQEGLLRLTLKIKMIERWSHKWDGWF